MRYTFGLPSLDAAVGRLYGLIEISGESSSGKTTLAYHLLRGGGLLVSTEHDYDPTLAPALIRSERLLVVRPFFGEAGLEAALLGLPGVVVVDSASALQPAVLRGRTLWQDTEEDQGARARMLAFGALRLNEVCQRDGGLVIFTQQLRSSLGEKYSSPTRIPYGRGATDLATLRIHMVRGGRILRGYRHVGVNIEAHILGGRGAAGAVVPLDLHYGSGFRVSASLLDLAVTEAAIVQKGSWYYLGDLSLGQGRDAACTMIEEQNLWGNIVSQLKVGAGKRRGFWSG